MFKKLLIVINTLIILIIFSNKSYAATNTSGDYLSYAALNCNSGKLIRDYSKSTINDYLKQTKKRGFDCWNYITLTKNTKADFISEMIYSFYNSGTTPISYKVDIEKQVTTKTQFSLTGSLEFEISGKTKEISSGLDKAVKVDTSYVEQTLVKNNEKLSIDIDPNTLCVIYIEGSGLLTNGVASRYLLWICIESGTFEFFTITNSYLRIEKIKL